MWWLKGTVSQWQRQSSDPAADCRSPQSAVSTVAVGSYLLDRDQSERGCEWRGSAQFMTEVSVLPRTAVYVRMNRLRIRGFRFPCVPLNNNKREMCSVWSCRKVADEGLPRVMAAQWHRHSPESERDVQHRA